MITPVSYSEAVERYRPLVESQARRFAKLEVPLAEYDDLVQVGMIRVWKYLSTCRYISREAVVNSMRDELRRVGVSPGVPMNPLPEDIAELDYVDGVDAD